MAAKSYMTPPFFSIIEGRQLKARPWPESRSRTYIRGTHFDKFTEDIKRLSSASHHGYSLPPVRSHLYLSGQICPFSPLDNSPLTGKAIDLRCKSNDMGMWRPSDSTPENCNCYLLDNNVPDFAPPKIRFRQTPWNDLLRLPRLQTRLSNLEGSIHARDSCPVFANKGISKGNMALPSIRKPQSMETFYPETGKAHVPLRCICKSENSTTIYISGHQPYRTRLQGSIPVLSVYHLFHTEFIFNSEVFESAGSDERAVPLLGANNENFSRFESGSEGTDVFCSAVSTGVSTPPLLERLLQDDIQEEPSPEKVDINTLSQNILNDEIKDDIPYSQNEEGEVTRSQQSFFIRESDSRSCSSLNNEAEVKASNTCVPTKDTGTPDLKDVAEVTNDKQLQRSFVDMDSEEVKEGCTFNEANVRQKQINPAEVPPTESKFKRSPQGRFKLCKNDSSYTQSEERARIMERLTKHARSQNISQELSQKPSNNFSSDNKNSPSSLSKLLLKPAKDKLLSTVNLQLDFTLKDRKVNFAAQTRSKRLLGTHSTWEQDFPNETSADDCTTCTLHDFLDGVSSYTTPRNVAQVVYMRKGVLYETTCDVLRVEGMLVHGQGLPTSAADIKDCISECKFPHKAGINSNEGQMPCPLTNGRNLEENKSDCKSFDPHCSQSKNVAHTEAIYLSDFAGSASSYEDYVKTAPNSIGRLYSFSDIKETYETSTGPAIDSASGVGHGDAYKDGNNQPPQVRSTCSRAHSVISLDDVPCNSPAESHHCFSPPAQSLAYINAVAHCQTHGDTTGRSRKASSRHDTNSGHNREDVNSYVNSSVNSPNNEGVSSLKYLNSDHDVVEDAFLQLKENSTNKRSCEELRHRGEDRNVVTSAATMDAPDLSPRSVNIMMSPTDGNLPSDQLSQLSKFDNESDDGMDNNDHVIDSHTRSRQLRLNTAHGHNSAGHHDDHFCDVEQEDYKSRQHLVPPHDITQRNGIPSNASESCIYDCKAKEKANTADGHEAVGAYKNVRFADYDKVISFQNYEKPCNDTAPHAVFYTPLSNVDTFPAIHSPRQGARANPCLYKQTLQFHTSSSYGNRQPLKKGELGNPQHGFCPSATGPMKSSSLRDIKWSSYSYKTKEPDPGVFCVRGRSLTTSRMTNRTRASEHGMSVNDRPITCDEDESVMYTICQKCERELHLKFGRGCCRGSGNG